MREGAHVAPLPDSDDEDAEGIIALRDDVEDKYYDALLELKAAFFSDDEPPCCHWFEIGGCKHGRPCACGKLRPPWPWIVHDPRGRFCACWREAERHAWKSRNALDDPKWGLWVRAQLHRRLKIVR